MSTPTARPWRVVDDPRASSKMPLIATGSDTPYIIAKVCGGIGPDTRQANAEFIVRACNAHDDLVASLQLMIRRYAAIASDDEPSESGEAARIDGSDMIATKEARAALAKVGAR